MSKPRNKWWSYVKAVIREYPAMLRELDELRRQSVTRPDCPGGHPDAVRVTENIALRELPGVRGREYKAVEQARQVTESYRDGAERLKLIRLVFWGRTRTLRGAALDCHISYRTAAQWHGEFIRLVAGFLDLLD